MTSLSLEERVERLEAVHEINNVIGRYAFYMHAGRHDLIVGLFAQQTDDVSCEVTSNGVYRGLAGVKRLWEGFLSAPRELLPDGEDQVAFTKDQKRIGRLTVHQFVNPVIEVARDGLTAKGVWMSPGNSASRKGDGKVQAYWLWGKCEATFIKEGGVWRFQHLHPYIIFRATFEKSWVEDSGQEFYPDPGLLWASKAYPPDEPPTYHKMYSPDTVLEMVPAPPEPY